jgi:hypothetical protein
MHTFSQSAARRNTEVSNHAAPLPSHFKRDSLPRPQDFYERELGRLSRPSRGWAKATCVFHHPDRHPSLNVNLISGAFKCFACQSSGGSVIDFVMLRDGMGFKTAAQALGAWQPCASSRAARADFRKRTAERARQARAVDDLLNAEKNLRLRYRGAIHALEADQRHAAERLNDPTITLAESEDCWRQLQASLDELRKTLAAHHLLTFGAVAERIEFIRHPDLREAAIQSVLGRGFVRDDDGWVTQVVLP